MMKGQSGYAMVAKHPVRGFSLIHLLSAMVQQLARWRQLAHERALLASLSDSALKDLGLSRADILQEVDRPFWDDPGK